MRVGVNPAKAMRRAPKPARITVVVVTYIPHLQGYYRESLEVLRICLDSLWRHTTEHPFEVLIFDNASGPEARQFLLKAHQEGRVQYLLLSEKNLGVVGAWNIAFQAAPGEIIAYADGDVYFHPGWLPASLALLETFPRVGMVTARPFLNAPHRWTATRAWAEQDPEAQTEWGFFLSWEAYRDFEVSLGRQEDEVRASYQQLQDAMLKIRYRGQEAIAGAGHWQFLAYKRVLQEVLPLPYNQPMGSDVARLDETLNQLGYLRLMTPEIYVDHIGNRLPDHLRDRTTTRPRTASRPWRKRLAQLPPVRKVLLTLYDRIFRLYYE